MSKKNIATFKATKNALYADNVTGEISAGDSRNADEDIADSFYNRIDTPILTTVDTSVSPITFNIESDRIKNFKGSVNISVAKTWAFSNVPSACVIEFFRFNITGAHPQTLPTNVKVKQDSGTLTDNSDGTREWTPFDSGDYEARMSYDGTTWFIEIKSGFI